MESLNSGWWRRSASLVRGLAKPVGRRTFLVFALLVVLLSKVGAWPTTPTPPQYAADRSASPNGALAPLGPGSFLTIRCVSILGGTNQRGERLANMRRIGDPGSDLRLRARVSQLSESELKDFCDWEACIKTQGYGHECWIDENGWERCRVCPAGAAGSVGVGDCSGNYRTQDACVEHAPDEGRGACHVGMLSECLIQRALRGYADPRVTQTCRRSAQACAGNLAGDLTELAKAARLETEQIVAEVLLTDMERPDGTFTKAAQMNRWTGGLPPDSYYGIGGQTSAGTGGTWTTYYRIAGRGGSPP